MLAVQGQSLLGRPVTVTGSDGSSSTIGTWSKLFRMGFLWGAIWDAYEMADSLYLLKWLLGCI